MFSKERRKSKFWVQNHQNASKWGTICSECVPDAYVESGKSNQLLSVFLLTHCIPKSGLGVV